MKKLILIFTFVVGLSLFSFAQDTTTTDISDELSLEDLMNVKVSVASQKSSGIRETPGSITIISDDDIKKSGARDLNDLLMRIPGFDMGRDYGNMISFGVRGIWGLEGKILFLLDGVNMNETNYGSFPTGNRVPLNQIKRIEIIRGPGSVIYGGVAGLAVVSIITKTGEDLNGVSLKGGYGYSDGNTSYRSGELSGGAKIKDLDLSIHAGWISANVSNMKATYWNTYPVNFADSSDQKSYMVNIGAKYKGLNLRFIREDYKTQRTFEDYNLTSGIKTQHGGLYFSGDYNWKLSKKINIIPAIQWKKMDPWNLLGDSANSAYNITAYRLQTSLKLNYAISEKLHVLVGSEYYQLDSKYQNKMDTAVTFEYTGKASMQLHNIAAFAELVYSSKIGNIMIGSRYDNHSTAGESLVPRIAYTKAWAGAHVKFTFSQAIKTPVIQNVELNKDLNPEKIQMMELEGGVKFAKNGYATVTLYDSKINGTYVYKETGTNYFYTNGGKLGTEGIESQVQWNASKINIKLCHAFYTAVQNKVDGYQIEGHSNVTAGMPSQKISGNIWVKLNEKFYTNTNVLWIGKRYSYAYDPSYNFVQYTLDPVFIWNWFVGGKNLLTKGLSVDIGVNNILGSSFFLGMPYGDGLNAIPLQRREFLCRITYDLKVK
jgi:outer membrane receptor for ferrienterochelin and colicin